MILGWGKAVKINAAPFTLPPSMRTMAPAVPLPPMPAHIQEVHPPMQGLMYPPGVGAAPFAPPPQPFVPPFAAGPPGYAAPPPFAPHGVPGMPPRLPPGVHLPPGFSAPPPPHVQAHQTPFPPAFAAPPPGAPAAVPTHVAPASEDLTTMSVDNFLDSIIASTKPATRVDPVLALAPERPPAATSAEAPSTASASGPGQFAHPPPAPAPALGLPLFRPPPPTTNPAVESVHVATHVHAHPSAPPPHHHQPPPPHLPPVPHAPPALMPPAPVPSLPAAPLRVDITVTLPEDPERQALIDLVAKFTAADGEAFEKVFSKLLCHVYLCFTPMTVQQGMYECFDHINFFFSSFHLHFFSELQNIKVREEGNPIYAFLFDLDCQEGQYYRWRTFGKCRF